MDEKQLSMNNIEIQKIEYYIDNYPEPSENIIVKMIKLEDYNAKMDDYISDKRNRLSGDEAFSRGALYILNDMEQCLKIKVVQ